MQEPTQRQSLLIKLCEKISNLEQTLFQESKALEEKSPMPTFFQPGGIYARLLETYPVKLFSTSTSSLVTSLMAITDEIESRLVKAKDPLNQDKEVGKEAAKEAIDNSEKRYRRERLVGEQLAWDDIGRYHSALRMLHDNKLLVFFTTDPRFKIFRYQGNPYFYYLALIWKGITEDNIKAPFYFAGIPSQTLKNMAIENFISVLAKCQRKNNIVNPIQHSDQNQAPQDAPCAPEDLLALFWELSSYNELYMQTQPHASTVEALTTTIYEMIFNQFLLSDPQSQGDILLYLKKKSIGSDPERKEVNALNEFILRAQSVVFKKLVDTLSPPILFESDMAKPSCLNLRQYFVSSPTNLLTLINSLKDFMENYLKPWVDIELKALRLIDVNDVSMTHINHFIQKGARGVLKQLINVDKKNKLKEISDDMYVLSTVPDFYADYLFELIAEKKSSGDYLIVDEKQLKPTLDLIFGNADAGISGLNNVKQNLVIYTLSRILETKKNQSPVEIERVKSFIDRYLKENQKGMLYKLNKHFITMAEVVHLASTLPSETWRSIIEKSGQQAALETFFKLSADQRQKPHYPEIMMDKVSALPLTLSRVKPFVSVDGLSEDEYLDKCIEKRRHTVTLWTSIAKSIFIKNDQQRFDLLVNFVIQTVMNQLGIYKFTQENKTALEQVVAKYMGKNLFPDFKLIFYERPLTKPEDCIKCLVNYLALMLTKLESPVLKTCFAEGMLQLLSLEDAAKIIQKKFDESRHEYTLHLCHEQPFQLMVTLFNTIDSKPSSYAVQV